MKRPQSLTLQLSLSSEAESVEVDYAKREITGLAVPYGPVGNSSAGAITFAKGSLNWSDIGRVKFLKQHDPERVIGFASSLDDRADGLYATFTVPESPEGDAALIEARDGRRDGLSVGVLLDEDTLDRIVDKWAENDNSPTLASGELLEVSQVSIPAFRDSRIDGSAAASLSGTVTLAVDFGNVIPKELEMADVKATVEAAAANVEMDDHGSPEPAPAAIAGAAVTTSEAPVYTFDGQGPSFVRDVFHARFSMDREAQDRISRFNSMMNAGDADQMRMVTAAVETRTTHTNYLQNGYKPEMLVATIDEGRPLTSRIGTVNLTDATPFRIPVEGDFSGVGDHTEGTSHVTEGTLTAGDVTFTPGAVSGAYRISRELVDASNPALDTIALRAMVRDYRGVTEGKVAAALLAADATATLNINDVMTLRGELNDFYDTNQESASFVVASSSYYKTLLTDVDTAGRPMLASVAPSNAAGTAPGWTGAHVDGVEIIKSSKIATDDAFLVIKEDVLIGESPLRTFRFDEVEGPGIVKLALWAYFGALVTRASSVEQITSAAV